MTPQPAHDADLTRASAVNRLTAVMALALALPPLLAVSYWAWPPGQAGLVPGWSTVGYLVAAASALLLAGRLTLVDALGGTAREPDFGRLRRRCVWSLIALGGYVAFGNAVVLARGAEVEPAPLQVLAAGLVQLLLAALPVAVYGFGVLGRVYGGRPSQRPALPTGSRLLVLGLLLPLLAASVLPVYLLQLRGAPGSAPPDHVAIVWLAVVGYVVALFVMAYRNQMRGLAPLKRLLDADDPQALPHIAAASLDDLGVCVNRLRDLLIARAGSEQALNDSENRTRMFAEAASDYLYEMDENLRFTFVSERFEELTGIPVALLIGQSATDLGRAQPTAQRRAHVEDLLAHRPYRDYRFSVRTRNGRLRHLQLRGLPIFDHDGRFRGYRGAGTDVTEFVETQLRLIEKEAELGQAQTMKALGQLTGGVAHDFNNFLTGFMGNLELALAEDMPDPARQHVQAALDGAHGSALLMRRLLAFARRRALRPEPVHVGWLLDVLGRTLQPQLGDRVQLTVTAADPHAVACADPAQLEEALAHLLVNAGDAMPDGGRITVTVDTIQLEARDPSGLPAMDYVRFVVADTGPGIHPHHALAVFEPFFTTKPPGQGSGLGLSMVYGFASQSGGRVRIDSPGNGTRVELLLPAAVERPDVTPQTFYTAASGQRLLLVEDDPSLSQVVAQLLRDLGYQVASVADGEAAVAFLDRHRDVDLVVCDVVLPGALNGLEVAGRARSTGHGARWLLMSGYALSDAQLRQAELAGWQLLRKPFRGQALAERIATILAGASGHAAAG